MERVIDVTSARRQFGTLLDEVFHKRDVITIQRKGKSLAKIIPLEDSECPDNQHTHITSQQLALLNELKSLPAISIKDDPVAVLRTMREKKRIQSHKQYGK
ncbi:MAG: type II toxin-antitoxin system Phd/YefM family antitoxin [Desulfobulbaceae bacterium]|nr:type II toxin-antitoxin system Phd/YefM family antitoxin [Desulfobulbaceae bacterium]